jgi:hypothetical protein
LVTIVDGLRRSQGEVSEFRLLGEPARDLVEVEVAVELRSSP